MRSVSHSLHKDLQSQTCWGLVLLSEYPGWATWCGAQNLSYLGRFSATLIILFLLVTYQGVWVLNVHCLHHSYPSCYGIFFISLIIANLPLKNSRYQIIYIVIGSFVLKGKKAPVNVVFLVKDNDRKTWILVLLLLLSQPEGINSSMELDFFACYKGIIIPF